jgi:hypothetical protein
MVGVMNASGETAYSFRSDESSEIHGGAPLDSAVAGVGDLLYVPRLAVSFDLSDSQTLLLGASAALGPNSSGPDASTKIFGGDLYYKWKATRASKGFPFVSVQAEAITRRYDTELRPAADGGPDLPAETFKDDGGYAQILWGIKPLVVAGLRGEFVNARGAAFQSDLRTDRYRISPNVTWYPTEFSKLRLQYNYDHREFAGEDHSILAQVEFLLGAHAAHKF